ncbi:2-oxoglutarate dehydrogenase E1 component [Candidatus Berkiella aquae]|uniref:2-oxoglutarate dehydrogenase E1 component n=1 Tax=Candidatus Berkiella aquae TaxID=295108 RepID=A0A0Q9YP56_9GAMM|nr:2-oxoglutarate dehydrogenase E1 component [Candidatus Berkiella aquae]MCS5712048.1 2-oxoglutarate dehydrogenase E1 component [Candidatus Berkiella aquae]
MQENIMKSMWDSSAFDGGNSAYLENLYEQYLNDPTQLAPQWRQYFDELAKANKGAKDASHAAIQAEFANLAKLIHKGSTQSVPLDHELKQIQVLRLINAYRLQGHLHAQIDPLGMREMLDENASELSLEEHGLGVNDMATEFNTETFVGPKHMQLGALYRALNDTYCGSIGTEYMHIPSREERAWIQQRVEGSRATPEFSPKIKEQILERLTAAEGLEKYIGVKYPGAKRFSLEGGEVLIPMLDHLIQRAGSQGMRECVIGMAHRGRLNVLINTLGKDPRELFDEFEGKHSAHLESGDVKYHQGFSSDVKTSGGLTHLALAFNPSHLEIVTPVVAGSVKARQIRAKDEDANKVLSVAIHGDAAFAGQGVVMETLNMSQTRGYGTGGTVHIVINNQVGFTTSNPHDARSTLYCTDVAKVVLAPIFHVNADDPEAVMLVTEWVLDYRMRFNKDVVIDLVCYRRHGHNEADDPFATQPMMYGKIKNHLTVRQLYAEQLTKEQVLTKQQADALVKQNREALDKGDCVANNISKEQRAHLVDWSQYESKDWREPVKTGISQDKINTLSHKLLKMPDGFSMHPRVAKIYEEREKMSHGQQLIDWGFAENMAYASLLDQGYAVRISGQDCGRGTFFHRHAVLHDQKTGKVYTPLKHIDPKQPHFTVIDSLLSEEAVLGFEYGYATTEPKSLVIWEAQFGDFANGAQVVIDQFISSGEQKWGRLCGLVMLLPHGYEGQGPEHSSARLERFLQLCAQHNIQVCVPSNASQVFHMLRRQMLRKIRKPLIVMSPKSLLRHKLASCELNNLIDGTFEVVIPETQPHDPQKVTKVVMCSGKVYYDLVTKRDELKKNHIAIIRIEQLYPFPEPELQAQLQRYPNVKDIVWCQEEPKNQGAWFPTQHHFRACMTPSQNLLFAGRDASASPAVGYTSEHNEQQEALIQDALK